MVDRLKYALQSLRKTKPDSAFQKAQLRAGVRVELEHTSSRRLAKEIAKHHLQEIPDYYTRLMRMENRYRIQERARRKS